MTATDETREELLYQWDRAIDGDPRTNRFTDAIAAHEGAVRSETLREAIEGIDNAGFDAYTSNEVVYWLSGLADKIDNESYTNKDVHYELLIPGRDDNIAQKISIGRRIAKHRKQQSVIPVDNEKACIEMIGDSNE